MSEYFITTFYKFVEIPRESLANLRSLLLNKGNDLNICGLLLLGVEGCNATIAGPEKSLKEFCDYLMSLPEIGALEFKNSRADKKPFRRFKVDIREEIVTIKNSDLLPQTGKNNHLSPQEWQAVLDSEEDFVLIDTRNFYETDVGVFKDAIDLRLKKFSDFGDKVRALNIDKKKKVLMYCTGGIRCEKAILEMQSDGFENVFQLEGGILKYLEELPNKSFEGECFVFDHRVSVDQVLQPSQKYKLCPHCGNPALQEISCKLCGTEKKVCRYCLEKEELNTCSKNCAHHYQRKMGKILSAA
jgi:UPF0176 protein